MLVKKRRLSSFVSLVMVMSLSACTSSKNIVPNTPTDAGLDASTDGVEPSDTSVDTGVVDAGVEDAGPEDVGVEDAGPEDAGPVDAGVEDTGPEDAEPVDAGVEDAGPEDVGVEDAGPDDPCDPDPCKDGETCVADDDGGVLCEPPVPCGGPCPDDLACVDDECVPHSARPIHPLSTSMSTTQRPYFEVELTEGADGTRIEICADHSCSAVLLTLDLEGDEGNPDEPLSPGVYFWRATAMLGAQPLGEPSVTWQVRVGHSTAAVNTSWGSMFDYNLDGFADGIVGGCGISACTPKVFIHQGGLDGFSETPTEVVTSDSPFFGFAVANAGDDLLAFGHPNLEFEAAVIEQDPVTVMDVPRQIGIGAANAARVPDNTLVGDDHETLPTLQQDRLIALQVADADLWPLQVGQQCKGPLLELRGTAPVTNGGRVVSVRSVREVDPQDVHARAHQTTQLRQPVYRRSDGSDDLGPGGQTPRPCH